MNSEERKLIKNFLNERIDYINQHPSEMMRSKRKIALEVLTSFIDELDEYEKKLREVAAETADIRDIEELLEEKDETDVAPRKKRTTRKKQSGASGKAEEQTDGDQ